MITSSGDNVMCSTELWPRTTHPPITIRPIEPADADMEAEFVRRLSPKTRRFRFLGGLRELTPKMLKSLCDVDYDQSMAFVATASEEGEEVWVGVSRYAPNTEEGAREMAVTVADDWQHQGVGTLLTKKLIEFAKDHGVKRLYSVDLADNAPMRQFADKIGMSVRHDPENAHQVIYSLTL